MTFFVSGRGTVPYDQWLPLGDTFVEYAAGCSLMGPLFETTEDLWNAMSFMMMKKAPEG